MAKLKMVAGQTYMCPALFGSEQVVTRDEVVDVPDDKVEMLLSDSYRDALNNEHFYFVEVGSDADPDSSPKTAKSRRRAA